MKLTILISCTLLLCFFSGVARASYSDGFFAIIMIAYALPFCLLGFIIEIILLNKKKFNSNKFWRLYWIIWVILGAVSFIALSLDSLSGSDELSPWILLFAWGIYLTVLIVPAGIQNYKANHSTNTQAS